jgi:hypothetical protein
MSVIEAVLRTVISINIPLEQFLQSCDSCLFVRTNGGKGDRGTGDDTEGHDTKQALGIHFSVLGFQPDGTLELISLLDEVGSLPIVQTGFTANNDILNEHVNTLLLTDPEFPRSSLLS